MEGKGILVLNTTILRSNWKYSIAFPAGKNDSKDTDAGVAARRELEEAIPFQVDGNLNGCYNLSA